MKRNGILLTILYIVGFYLTQIFYNLLIEGLIYLFNGQIPYRYLFDAGIQLVLLAMVYGYIYLFRRYLLKYALEEGQEFDLIKCNTRTCFVHLFIGMAIGLIMGTLVCSIRYMFGTVEKIEFYNFGENFIILCLSLISTGLAVIMEEIVFRGTLFVMLRRFNKSVLFSAVVTGIFFSMFHVAQGTGILDLLFYFLFSILLCHIIEKTNNIWAGVGLHLGWNIIAKGLHIFSIEYKTEPIMLLKIKSISILIVILAMLGLKVVERIRAKNQVSI